MLLLSYGHGNNGTDDNKKCKLIVGRFDGHGNAAMQRDEHCPMEHIQGYTGSHKMLPSGKSLRCIAPAASMVDYFDCKHKNTHKTLTKHNF